MDQNFSNLDDVMNEIQVRIDSTMATKKALDELETKVNKIEVNAG